MLPSTTCVTISPTVPAPLAGASKLDMLKETDLRIHLTDLFQSPTGREHLDRATLQRRLLLCLVYVNTLLIQRLLREPAWQGRLTPEDLRALTPLIYSHVNLYGGIRLPRVHD
jgi:hypothetical protein